MPGRPPSKRGYKHFFSLGKIEIDWDTGCWIWLGSQYDDGYGCINRRKNGGRGKGGWSACTAQKYFYELYRGPLPPGVDVSHNCHRRLCVRLKHLVPETHPDNMRLMFEDWKFGPTDMAEFLRLVHEGYTVGHIADKLMAPRPYVMKLLRIHQGESNGSFNFS
jgi:hypothetical protein